MKRSSAAWLRSVRLTVTFIVFPGSNRPSRTALGSPGVTLRLASAFDRAGAAFTLSTADPAMAMATTKLKVRCLSLMPPLKIAGHHTEIALRMRGPVPLRFELHRPLAGEGRWGLYKSSRRKRRTGWDLGPGGGGSGGPGRVVIGDGAGAGCGATVSGRGYLIRPVPCSAVE